MEAEEISNLENILMRLALTDDEKLEKVLSKLLPRAIGALHSANPNVLKKVMEILSHVNKRVKALPKIHLPLDEMLELLDSGESTPMMKNFSLVYFEMGFPRASPEERGALVSRLLEGISKRAINQQESLLHMAVSGLEKVKIPMDNAERDAAFPFTKSPADVSAFLSFCQDFLLYYPVSGESADSKPAVPSSMSENAVKKITRGKPVQADAYVKQKVELLKFLSSGMFFDGAVLPHFLIAACDPHNAVIRVAEDALRKLSKPDLDNLEIIMPLMHLYLGNPAIPGRTQVDPSERRSPANIALKLRILPYFCKSVSAANRFPYTLQVVFDCVYGTTTSIKLKQNGMQFALWIFKQATDAQLKPMGPVILSALVKLIQQLQDQQGASMDFNQLKDFSYSALGQLAQRVPSLFSSDLAIVRLLFEASSRENANTRISVQEALSLMWQAFKDPAPAIAAPLLQLLLQEMCKRESTQARLCAVQWANRIFPSNHVASRYICLVGYVDPRPEIREEARRGVSQLLPPDAARFDPFPSSSASAPSAPSGSSADASSATPIGSGTAPGTVSAGSTPGSTPSSLPSFPAMVAFVHAVAAHLPLPGVDPAPSDVPGRAASSDAKALGIEPSVLDVCLQYCRLCLHDSASAYASGRLTGSKTTPRSDSDSDVAAYVLALDPAPTPTSGGALTTLGQYLNLLERGLGPGGTQDLLRTASAGLQQLVEEVPDVLAKVYAGRVQWLLDLLVSNSIDTRENIAATLGVLVIRFPGAPLVPLVQQLLTQVADKDTTRTAAVFAKHGRLLAIGHLVASAMKGGLNGSEAVVEPVLQTFYESLSDSTIEISMAACQAFGCVARVGPLPLPDKAEGEGGATDGKDVKEKEVLTKLVFVNKLKSMLTAPETKIAERSVVALGDILIGNPTIAFSSQILDTIFSLSKVKDEQVQFTVGETLATILRETGSRLPSPPTTDGQTPMDTSEPSSEPSPAPAPSVEASAASPPPPPPSIADVATLLVESVLNKYVRSGTPIVRTAGAIWLLCLVKNAGATTFMQDRLPAVHASFSSLLGDTNEVVQEVSSKGIATVYEIGDAKMKETLVGDLVSTLSGTARAPKQAGQMSDDTQLFSQGSLGEVPGGGGISTYRELCSLASDLGKPDLIYKFLDLASHNALWNSRKGMALGFGAIATQAREKLIPYLPSLLPKLYRYQYDPNERVQAAMTQIFEALVTDRKKAVDEHYAAIMKDVLHSMGSKQWRQREAACLALADLCPGRRLEQVREFLPQMWTMTFRALDDIKESVRKAAQAAGRSVSGLSIRLCSTDQTSAADVDVAVSIVLPLIVSDGILSPAEEVKKTALSVLLKLMNAASTNLKPYIPDIAPVLLESMSVLEPQSFSYLQLNADKYDISSEQLENVRMSASSASPVGRALEICVKQVDEGVMDALAPKLASIIRTGVGLPTRGATARFLIQLATNQPQALNKCTGRLLRALQDSIAAERSVAVRRAFASAAAHVFRAAKDKQRQDYVDAMTKLYSNPGDEDARLTSAIACRELSKNASDAFKGVLAQVLPVAFIGRHAQEADAKEIWKEIWEENAMGMENGCRLYLTELLVIIQSSLSSSNWWQKRQGALALKDLCTALSASVLKDHVQLLLKTLLDMLPGRLWEGKEDIFGALAALCKTCQAQLLPQSKDIIQALLKESLRPKKEYKARCLECLSQLLATFSDEDFFAEVKDVVASLANPPLSSVPEGEESLPSSSSSAAPSKEGSGASAHGGKIEQLLREKALECLGKAWRTSTWAGRRSEGRNVLEIFGSSMVGATVAVRVAAMSALQAAVVQLPPAASPVRTGLAEAEPTRPGSESESEPGGKMEGAQVRVGVRGDGERSGEPSGQAPAGPPGSESESEPEESDGRRVADAVAVTFGGLNICATDAKYSNIRGHAFQVVQAIVNSTYGFQWSEEARQQLVSILSALAQDRETTIQIPASALLKTFQGTA